MQQKLFPSHQGWRDFLMLVDPGRGIPEISDDDALARLLKAADVHGLTAIVLRKLSENDGWKRRLPEGSRKLDQARETAVLSMGLTMMLEHYYLAISEKLAKARLRAVVVKGPVFARNLYSHVNDRPFTDIDLLAHPDDMAEVGQILAELGFTRFSKGMWDRSDTYQEQKWLLGGNANIMIELHGNLVHYPSLRRRVSFGYADFKKASQKEVDCPVALFMTAVVHASLGHKFHKLQLLVDILQAFRRLSEAEVAVLVTVAAQLSLRLEVALCLNLIADTFGDPRAKHVAQRVALPAQSALASSLVSPQMLLETQGQSRLRRHAFRWLQSLHLSR